MNDEKFGAAIFFDNDANRIAEVGAFCNTIRLVPVRETEGLRPTLFTAEHFEDYIDSLDYNTYLEAVQDVGVISDLLDPVSGIEDDHIATFDAWLEETEDIPNRVALFDWDRTITVIEGFYGEDLAQFVAAREVIETSLSTWREDALLYLCGGAERLAKLRAMFARAHAAGVQNVVLTNNSVCGEDNFTNLAEHLFHPLPVKAICGRFYNFHKGQALRAQAQFSTLCASSGGSRRRRQKSRRNVLRKERRTRKRNTRSSRSRSKRRM
jgi:hypothetical protein